MCLIYTTQLKLSLQRDEQQLYISTFIIKYLHPIHLLLRLSKFQERTYVIGWDILSKTFINTGVNYFVIIIQKLARYFDQVYKNRFMSAVAREPNIKQQLFSITNNIEEMRKVVSDHHKELGQLKQALAVDEYILQDPFKEVREYFLVARQNLRVDFEKNCESFQQQSDFLKDQMEEINSDQLRVVQNSLQIEKKLRQLCQEVGIPEQDEQHTF